MRSGFCTLATVVLMASGLWPAAESFAVVVVPGFDNGPSGNRVNIVFLGDGYTTSQIETTYVTHINAMLNRMFNQGQDPFPRYHEFFNAYRVNVVSNQSGADYPPSSIYRDTALDASYRWDGVTDRLLYVSESKATAALNNGLLGTGITAGMKLVTVNDTRYGGGGGGYAVYAGGHASAPEVAMHEMGHSFSNLADEYFYTSDTYNGGEPWSVNVTANSNPETCKWSRWIGYSDPNHPEMGAIGLYEGGMYNMYGIYRPSDNSKMRSLNRQFDAISREKIILDIYRSVDPLDGYLSNSTQLVDPQDLWVDVVDPAVLQVQWSIDGQPVAGATGEHFDPPSLALGTHTISATAFDGTDWVRITPRPAALSQTVTWSVLVTVPEPSTLVLMCSGMLVLAAWAVRRRRG